MYEFIILNKPVENFLLTGMCQAEIHHGKLFLNGNQVMIKSGVYQMLGP
jgi:hypothetical protein